MPIRCASSASYARPRKKISRANFCPTCRARYAEPKPPSKEPTSASVCLNRACSRAGQGQVADHVQAVPAAGRPAVDQGDHHLGHEPDQPLHLQDVQPARRGRVDRVGASRRRRTGSRPGRGSAGRRRCRTPSRRPWATGRCRSAAPRRRPSSSGRGRAPGTARRRCAAGTRCAPRAGRTRSGPPGRSTAPVVGDVGEVEALDRLPQLGVERRSTHAPTVVPCIRNASHRSVVRVDASPGRRERELGGSAATSGHCGEQGRDTGLYLDRGERREAPSGRRRYGADS